MKIANVIHEKELVNHTKAEFVNYITEPTEYDSLVPELPTLYVGWSFMKACNPENELIQNADILKKRIVTGKLYWECSFAESKASHVKGVDNFVKHVPEFYFMPRFAYTNLDPVFFNLRDVQDLMDVVPKDIIKAYNYKNEMLYVLKDNKITGIDLRMYEYFKFDVKVILEKIKDRTFFYKDDPDGEIYQSYYKIFPDFAHLKRYIIVILSK